jgi:hypothetical protein
MEKINAGYFFLRARHHLGNPLLYLKVMARFTGHLKRSPLFFLDQAVVMDEPCNMFRGQMLLRFKRFAVCHNLRCDELAMGMSASMASGYLSPMPGFACRPLTCAEQVKGAFASSSQTSGSESDSGDA